MDRSEAKKLTKLANAAFRQAAEKVLQESERTGVPLVVWEDGEIKKIDAKEMRKKMKAPRRSSGKTKSNKKKKKS